MRRMKKRPLIIGLIVMTAVFGGVVIGVSRRGGRMAHEKAIYFCQMHPGIVSDRPGECPICHMQLVKREEEPVPSSIMRPSSTSSPKDVCYLHQCPMMKPGQPCPMLVVAKAGEKVTCPICGTHVAGAAITPQQGQGKKILYWTDPMIPGYKSDKPGTSPMGMDLIPVYEEDGTGLASQGGSIPGYAPILVTPRKQQFIGVKITPARKHLVTKTIRTVGVVAHDPELYQAQEEFIQANRASERAGASHVPEVIEQAQGLVKSSRLRLRHLGLSEEMIDEVATWTEPDHRLLLGGGGRFWVYASIYEYELPLVRVGQTAAIEVSALPDKAFVGTVKAIDPILDPMTRTTRVRIIVEDPGQFLRPEVRLNVRIAVDLGELLTVPEEAVFITGEKHMVFVDKGQGLFEPRDVLVGVKADGAYEIQAGVAEGERVVTNGNFLIDSESRLKAALQGMSEATSAPAPVEAQSSDMPNPHHDMTGGGDQHGQ